MMSVLLLRRVYLLYGETNDPTGDADSHLDGSCPPLGRVPVVTTVRPGRVGILRASRPRPRPRPRPHEPYPGPSAEVS